MIEINRVYNENCLDTMGRMPDECVDLVITSPPYDNLRDYQGYDFDFESIAKELSRIIKTDGIIVWIVNDATINGSETGTSFRQALYFKDSCGLNIHDTMIWQKISPYQHKNRYIQSFEYMFVFSKGHRKHCNLIKDRKNKWSNTQIHGTERKKNGICRNLSDFQKRKVVKEYGARYNIWDISPEKNNKTNHPAPFVLQIANDHITSWSNEQDLVYDPMMGSGTVAEAAILLNRKWIGSEISSEYCDIINERIANII